MEIKKGLLVKLDVFLTGKIFIDRRYPNPIEVKMENFLK